MTINGKELNVKKILGYSNEVVKLTGNLKQLKNNAENITIPKLEKTQLDKMYEDWGRGKIDLSEIQKYKQEQQGLQNNEQNVSSSFWDILIEKIRQVIPVIQSFKQNLKSFGDTKELELVKYKISEIEEKLERAKNGEIHLNTKEILAAEAELERLNNKKNKIEKGSKGGFFSGFFSSLNKIIPSMQNISGITIKIKNQIKQWNNGVKGGLKHVLKYAMALFSLRGIYSILSNCASSWLSSQNAGAKQLSANIDYMKYAMGSALAPVIEFVINLVYQLMKAIQSVAYALTGVNIFAKATASSYSNMAGSAKKAKEETKQLAGVHNEINNIQDDGNSDSGSGGGTSPSFDLSQMDNTPNSIIDAIKNGNWYEVGAMLGQKLNDAMNSIPWDKIQETAKKIGTNIAQFLNGFIATTDWNQVGNTFAQGLNTIIYFGYSFVTTFDWKKFGKAIGDSINGFFKNVDWATAGQTLGEGIKGIFDTITTTFTTINWAKIGQDIVIFLVNIDWNGVISGLCSSFGAALGGISATIASILLEAIIYPMAEFFREKTQEAGGNVVLGVLKGIVDGLIGIGEWIYNNMVYPLIEAFCSALGIHSPSTVFAEFGKNIIQGLFNGIQSLVNTITQIWNDILNTAKNVFNGIKDTISNIWNGIVNITSNVWNTIVLKVSQGVQGAWNAITSVFGNVANWFRDKFSQAWQAVKNVFSTGGKIFDGIKDGILNGLKSIVNAIIGGINKVISIPFNGINSALKAIKSVNIMGLQPFSWIKTISVPQIPRLAKGGIIDSPTIAMMGEYAGAKSNPEIVTPQNIMRETMEDVFSDYLGNNDQPISLNLTVNVGNKKLGQIALEDIREKIRRTGKDIEALVGG